MNNEPHLKFLYLSQMILGGQDGLVNVLGVLLGVAAASESTKIIIAVGLAATFAESIAMAAVAYTSKMAERDLYEGELRRERREIKEIPHLEEQEIRDIYRQKGFKGKLLAEIVKRVTSDEKIWLETMMREELQLTSLNKKQVLRGTVIVGVSSLIGSLIPLFPFFLLPVKMGIIFSFLFSAVALFLVGFYKSRLTIGKPLRGGIELLIIGLTAALIGYFIGTLFKP